MLMGITNSAVGHVIGAVFAVNQRIEIELTFL